MAHRRVSVRNVAGEVTFAPSIDVGAHSVDHQNGNIDRKKLKMPAGHNRTWATASAGGRMYPM